VKCIRTFKKKKTESSHISNLSTFKQDLNGDPNKGALGMKRVPGKVARRQQKPRIVSIGITMYMAVTFRKKKTIKEKPLGCR
jgi:hypothetical protein